MVADSPLGGDGVQKSECLPVLDGDVRVPDHPEDVVGVGADDRLPERDGNAVGGGQIGERDLVIEAGSFDSLQSRGGGIELGPHTVPWDLADVHHRGASVQSRKLMTHLCQSLLRESCPEAWAGSFGPHADYPTAEAGTPGEARGVRMGD